MVHSYRFTTSSIPLVLRMPNAPWIKIGLALALIMTVAPLVMPPRNALPQDKVFPWTAYFGVQNRPTPWAGFVRGIGRSVTGMVLRPALPSEAIKTTEFGQFLGQVKKVIQTRDVLIPFGGPGSAKKQDEVDAFMALVEQDEGATWKTLVQAQTRPLAELPEAQDRVYWQIGNEINSKHYSRTLRSWAKLPGPPRPNDQAIIPLYVEYFLAPTAEALEAASLAAFGEDGQIGVVLGTIANAGFPKPRKWLDSLLRYEIDGRFAKSLAGKKVMDVVDVIAVHYIVTSDDTAWRPKLDALRSTWLGQGRVKGIWATEELGSRRAKAGLGATTTLKVVFRFLHWWGRHDMTPREGRCSFYGVRMGKPGTRGEDALGVLYDFLGDAPIAELSGLVLTEPDEGLETYAFEDLISTKRVIAAIAGGRDLPIGRLVVRQEGWTGDVAASLHVFSPAGHERVPLTAQRHDGGYALSPPAQTILPGDGAALIFLEQS